jgi:DnaK suppressor protein
MLTVTELMAQPKNDYMNDGQVAFFKDRLARKAQDLRDDLNAHRQDVEIERHSDEADFASDEEERAVAVKMIERDRVTLGQMSHALDLIRQGDYGFCIETGEPVGLQRLLLVPESVYCVESMRVIEAKKQTFTAQHVICR